MPAMACKVSVLVMEVSTMVMSLVMSRASRAWTLRSVSSSLPTGTKQSMSLFMMLMKCCDGC